MGSYKLHFYRKYSLGSPLSHTLCLPVCYSRQSPVLKAAERLLLNHEPPRRSDEKRSGYQARQQQRVFSCFYRPCSCLYAGFYLNLQPLFCTRAVLVSFYAGAVYTQVFKVSVFVQVFEYIQKRSFVAPFAESAVYRLVRAVSLGQILPTRSASCYPQYGIEHQTIILGRASGFRTRYHYFYLLPLFICYLISFLAHVIPLFPYLSITSLRFLCNF